jgi:hypothetical protein
MPNLVMIMFFQGVTKRRWEIVFGLEARIDEATINSDGQNFLNSKTL